MAWTVHAASADEQQRVQFEHIRALIQQATGNRVGMAWANQGTMPDKAKEAVSANSVNLQIFKLSKRWVVERGLGRLALLGP
ncbi:hypothetical protein [Acidovorax sp. Leaf78]|uniref:hypothetical protein n=1 Tax=unclassified Acidovorax TaxID=2684926 RepID=UPI0006F4A09E|nr:hypothetical protein [Acidovorax sp. Leaf78]KQO27829.1 hypothetical protein ASF16_03150 [Acidovorax sp. Leaf78]